MFKAFVITFSAYVGWAILSQAGILPPPPFADAIVSAAYALLG